ncbi:MAG: Hsp20/alpha crystallin family protein [Hungatella sp.]|nr:Hsp20/alpha crystallin family protein [Hungatella sp.]
MLMPSIFGENLFDNFMEGFPFGSYRTPSSFNSLMKTDIRDMDQSYELDIDMPGFKKEDIKAELKNGYLTIEAQTSQDHDEKDEKGRYIRRERYTGSCQRSFYVGKEVAQEDINARFEDGILKLTVPKKEALPKAEENRYIAIQ